MAKQEDLSNFAAFDLDDLLAEISSNQQSQKEVTAYLDRDFIINSLLEYKEEAIINKQEFTADNQIDFTDYNFTGADLTGFKRKDLDLLNFYNCDITSTKLDRISLEFFLEYIKEDKIIFQGLVLDGAYLGPKFTRRIELGIECYMNLDLSNLNLSGTSFRNADIEKLILENTNISGCDFTNAINLDPKQFAFTMGFETAIFSKNKEEDKKIKEEIKNFSDTLEPDQYYNRNKSSSDHAFIRYLANLTNVLDD